MSRSNNPLDLVNISKRNISIIQPEVGLEIPTGFCRVASLEVNGRPLSIKIPGVVATKVSDSFKTQYFFLDLDSKTINHLNALESIYFEHHPEVAEFFKFKTCILDTSLLRIKMPISQTGRRYQFTSDISLTPQDTSVIEVDQQVTATVEPRFYFMDGNMGLFLKTVHLQFGKNSK